MGGKSSKSKKKDDARITQNDRAVLELKLQRDRLQQYKKKINTIMEREHEIARQLLREGKKPAALLALKKKRAQAKMLISTDQKIDKVEEWVNTVESAQRDMQMFEAIKVGKEALEEIHKEMSLEAVEQLLLEKADAEAVQREIEEALAGKLEAVDEEAMERELEALSAAQAQATSTPAEVPSGTGEFPVAPTEVPVLAAGQIEKAAEEEEEEEDDHVPLPPPPAQASQSTLLSDDIMSQFPSVPSQPPVLAARPEEEEEEEEEDSVPLPPPQLATA